MNLLKKYNMFNIGNQAIKCNEYHGPSFGNDDIILEDTLLETIWWKLITKEIKEFKENLSKASSEAELEQLKDSILESLKAQASAQTTTSTTTATSWTSTSTGNNTSSSSLTGHTSTTSVGSSEYTSSTTHYEIDRFNINVTQDHKEMYNQLKWVEKPDLEPFACAMKWYEKIKWSLRNPTYLTVVDFTKPNNKNRFYVINMNTKKVEYATTVWHWSGSWKWVYATDFSNINWSYQSSLWFFRTPDHINKPSNRNRKWLLMNWIEWSNNKASSRWIYMHPGWLISLWCFTLPQNKSTEIMNKVKWDSLLFAYAKSKDYFSQSQYFSTSTTWDVLAA